jgi:hypothetical protein
MIDVTWDSFLSEINNMYDWDFVTLNNFSYFTEEHSDSPKDRLSSLVLYLSEGFGIKDSIWIDIDSFDLKKKTFNDIVFSLRTFLRENNVKIEK